MALQRLNCIVMRKRGWSHYCRLLGRYSLLNAPATVFDAGVLLLCPAKMVRGIRVIDPAPETCGRFEILVDGALSLIARADPIRFKRVQREIRSIVNAPAPGGSNSRRPLRVCSLNLKYFHDPNDPEMTVRLVASALIREATYGHLFSQGILPAKKYWLRCDELSCKEPQRFLRRLGMTTTPWDPELIVTWPSRGFWRSATKEIRAVFGRE